MSDKVIRRPVERMVPQAARPPVQVGLHVDVQGFVCVDGMRVARLVERNGTRCLQFADRCKPRIRRRGTRYVEVPVREVANLESNGNDSTIGEEESIEEMSSDDEQIIKHSQ